MVARWTSRPQATAARVVSSSRMGVVSHLCLLPFVLTWKLLPQPANGLRQPTQESGPDTEPLIDRSLIAP